MAIKAFSLFGEISLKGDQGVVSNLKKVSHQVDATKRDLHSLKGAADSAGRGMSSSFSGLGNFLSRTGANVAGNLLSQGLNAITGGIKSAVEAGQDYNRTLEQSLIGFETLLGSKAAAIQHVKELEAFAFKTPFTSSELFKLSPMLQGVGFAAKDVIPILTSVGNALAATGNSDSLERVIRQLGQMQAKGRVSFEEMNVLAENGINAWRMLAEAIVKPGENVEALQAKMMHLAETGQLMSKDVMPVLFGAFDKKYGGAMERVALETQYGVKSSEEDIRQKIAGEGLRGTKDFDFTGGAYGSETERSRKRVQALEGARGDQLRGLVGSFGGKYGAAVDYLQEEMLSPMAGRDQFLNFFGKLTNGTMGENIVKPMIDSLKSGASAVGQAAASFGQSIYKGLNDIWQWGSPSKTAIQLGEWINEGFEIGLGKTGNNYSALLGGLGEMRRGGGFAGSSQRDYLEQVGQNPTVRAFFEAIKKAEGGGENIIVGGKRFSDLSDHPNVVGLRTSKGPSTAAGSWQITGSNWFGRGGRPGLKEQLGLTDFTEQSQYLAALKLFTDRDGGAGMRALMSGDIQTAMKVAAKDWTSTPGSTIGGGKQLSQNRWMGYFNNALGSGGGAASSPAISKTNPIPVTIIDAGNGVDFRSGPSFYDYKDPELASQIDAARGMYAARRDRGQTGQPGIINDPIPVIVEVQRALEPITETFNELGLATSITLKPLKELLDVEKEMAKFLEAEGVQSDAAARLRAQVDGAGSKKKKKDPLFDSAFTREGLAGDFHGGLSGLLGNMGWQKPGALGMQFITGLARDLQARWANDFSSSITEMIFGGRDDKTGKLGGGLFDKVLGRSWGNFDLGYPGSPGKPKGGGIGDFFKSIFGSLFGGGRASGGSVSAGRFYMVGEHGPEFFAPGQGGHVYNNRETKQMMGGGGGSTQVFFALGDRAVEDMNNQWYGSRSAMRKMIKIQGRYGKLLRA